MGELVRLGLDLRIGRAPIAEQRRHRFGPKVDLAFEPLMEARLPIGGVLGAVPVDDDLLALRRREQRQVADAGIRVGDDALQQRAEVPDGPLDRGVVEEITGVLELADEVGGRSGHPERQIELAVLLGDREGLEPEPGPLEALPRGHGDDEAGKLGDVGALEREGHLEQRGSAGVAGRLQSLDEQRERVVLVGDGRQGHLVDLALERSERRVAGEVRANGKHVHAMADEGGELPGGAPSSRRTGEDLGLLGVPVEQHDEGGEQETEGRRALLPRQRGDPARGGLVDDEGNGAATERLQRRPGAVGGELEDRGSGTELLGPPPRLSGALLALQEGCLPGDEVGVVHVAGRKVDRGTRHPRVVLGPQLVQHRRHGDQVHDRVVGGDHEHVVIAGPPPQVGPEAGPLLEGVRPVELLLHRQANRLVAQALGACDRQRDLHLGLEPLDGTGAAGMERGSERRVAGDHALDGGGQGVDVEGPAQPRRHVDVVRGGRRSELLQVPQ